MSDEKRKLIIDNNSLIDFFNYYYFDRDNKNKIYNDIKEFIFSKIKSNEIIIIDKVFKEFKHIDFQDDLKDIKSKISPFIVNTDHLILEVEKLSKDYYIEYNERYINDKSQIVAEMEYILNGADLYLIALCLEYKNEENLLPTVVTEESFNKRNYKKLVDKIPIICKKENIKCVRLPHSLFNIYKDELEFNLNIK